MRNWTPEERRKQAEACRRAQPWKKSTGPKTRRGKRRASLNAFKTGAYTPHWRYLRAALLGQYIFLANLRHYHALEEHEKLTRAPY